jgi:hypothetical protein
LASGSPQSSPAQCSVIGKNTPDGSSRGWSHLICRFINDSESVKAPKGRQGLGLEPSRFDFVLSWLL